MPQVRSEDELRRALRQPLQEAVDYVMDKIYDENIGAIHDVVYMAYEPEEYNRTGDFYTAWAITQPGHNPTNKDAYGKFYYKGNEMSIGSTDPDSPNYAQHIGVAGDYYGKDSRAYLADIIYGGIKWGSAFGTGAWQKKRDAWAELVKRVGKHNMKQWFKEGLQKAGLEVIMHNVAIAVDEVN